LAIYVSVVNDHLCGEVVTKSANENESESVDLFQAFHGAQMVFLEAVDSLAACDREKETWYESGNARGYTGGEHEDENAI